MFRTSGGVRVGFVGGRFGGVEGMQEGEGEGVEDEVLKTLGKDELRAVLGSSTFEGYSVPLHTQASGSGNGKFGSSSNSIPVPFENVNINPTTSGPSSSQPPKSQTLAQARAEMKKQQAESASSSAAKGVDVVIFAEGNGKVLKCLPEVVGAAGVSAGQSEGEKEVDEFIGRSRPRYVFLPTPQGTVSTVSGYAEAVPFGWTGGAGGKEERWTRVVRLDRFAEDPSEGASTGAGGKAEKGEKKKVSLTRSLGWAQRLWEADRSGVFCALIAPHSSSTRSLYPTWMDRQGLPGLNRSLRTRSSRREGRNGVDLEVGMRGRRRGRERAMGGMFRMGMFVGYVTSLG